MKNNGQKFLLVLMLLLFIGSRGVVVIMAQNTNNTAQSTSSAEPKRTDPPQARDTPAADKQDKAREEKKTEQAKREESARQRTQDLRAIRGATNTAPLGNTSENQTSNSNTTAGDSRDSRDSSRELKSLNERVDKIEKELAPKSSWLIEWMPDWLKWALIACASILVLAGIVMGYSFLRHNKERERGEIAANFTNLKKQQRVFGEKIKQLEEVSKNLSQQIAQQKSELSGLQQTSRNASYAPPPPPVSAYPQPMEVSQFPVMVDDYLARVKNRAIPVKYDYKERMLVEDRENEGNLLVVRDDVEEDALYLVPSFGFFQKKSDYTTYFENYYACARPVNGSVWIRQPAMVNRVNGGWQLEQLGELEVR